MTGRDRAALCRYIRWVADEIGLRDWTIVLSHKPTAEGFDGAFESTFGQRQMVMQVSASFRTDSPENQRDTVVHELIHAHLAVMQEMVEDDLAKALGESAHRLFSQSYIRQLELAVDALTKALVKQLPLIDWPKAKEKP